MPVGLLFTAILLALSGAQARDPARDGAAVEGRVIGRVVAGDTGRPVAGATVTFVRVNEQSIIIATTDDEGRFVLDGVKPGSYSLRAGKPGIFVETSFGQSSPELPGRILMIKGGEEIRADVAIFRGAVIAGRVFDHSGEPLALAVVALSPTDTSSGTAPSDLRTATNDRGEFRLFGLKAGEYIMSATPPRPPQDRRKYAPIYYPGLTDIASATRIQLVPGQEIINADITVRIVATTRVTGMAVGPDGLPLPGGSIAVYLAGSDGRILPRHLLTRAMAGFDGLSGVGSIKPDGTFSLEILPGQYVIRGRYDSRVIPADAIRYSGALLVASPLSVGDSDVSNVLLKFTHGATVKGRLVFEGASPPATQPFRLMIETGEPGAVATTVAGADGTFVLGGIESGSRRLQAVGPSGWLVKGIYLNGRDIADQAIEIEEEMVISDVSVVFTPVKTPLTVAVDHPGSGALATVLVFPEDGSRWHAASRRTVARVATDSHVVFDQLPPGDYLVVALADVAPDSLKPGDTRLLDQLRPIAQRVELVEGRAASVRLIAQRLPK